MKRTPPALATWLTWIICLVAAPAAARAQAADEARLHQALDRFTGEWVGEVQVRALDGFVLKILPATRRYVWTEGVQTVETTLRDPAGDYVVTARQTIRLGRLEAATVRPSLPEDRYVGEAAPDGIAWTNVEGNRRDAHDRLAVRDDATVLDAVSVEPVRGLGLSGLVRMVGVFHRADDAAAVPAAEDAGTIEGLRRELEVARAALAARPAEDTEPARRAAGAEARVRELETELAGLREALEAARGGERDASARADRLEAGTAGLQDEVAKLQDQLAATAGEVEQGDTARRQLAGRLAMLDASLGSTAAERDALRQKVEALEKEVAAADARAGDLLGAQTAAAAREEQSGLEIEEARSRLRQALAEAERLQAESTAAAAERAAAEAELERTRASASVAVRERASFDEARAMIASLEAALADARQRAGTGDDEIAALRLRNGIVLQERDEAVARAAELEQAANALRAQIETLRTESSAGDSAREQGARDLAAALKARALADEIGRQREAEVATLSGRLVESDDTSRRAEESLAQLRLQASELQRDNERLVAANARLELERAALERRANEAEALATRVPAPAPPEATPAAGAPGSIAAVVRDQLMGEVQQLERRALELESERNAAREQAARAQQQVDETRGLRDDTLARFQAVVAELNALREEKDRLARANLSLQSELRTAQQARRESTGRDGAAARADAGTPATTIDGRTADMVIAALQIIGVTRGETEDKAILDGRVYRNGDVVEPELGIVFERIEDNSIVFRDRRGREYRRRF